MTRHFIAIAIIAVLSVAIGGFILSSGPTPNMEEHSEQDEHAGDHSGEHEDESEHIEMSDDVVQSAGIIIAVAGTATIRETVPVMGRVTLDPRAVARVGARFPGTVRELSVAVGDVVRAGQTLAMVESNESLQRYALKSSVSGVVVKVNGTVGDVIGDIPLLEVVDASQVWVEFHVFPKDLVKIRIGQDVFVHAAENVRSVQTRIDTVLPVADEATQSVIVRASVDNPEGLWRPGMSIRGDIAVATNEISIAVRTSALQTLEDESVVFVREGDAFEVRRVITGAGDEHWTEVVRGLDAGESYAATNSFLLKADLGKSSAEHSH